MNSTSRDRFLNFVPVRLAGWALVLAGLLFASDIWGMLPPVLGSVLGVISSICRDSQTQWILVVFLFVHYVVLLLVGQRRRVVSGSTISRKLKKVFALRRTEGKGLMTLAASDLSRCIGLVVARSVQTRLCRYYPGPDLLLFIFLVMVLLDYASAYKLAVASLQILVLLSGIAFGKAVSTSLRLERVSMEKHAVMLIFCVLGLLAGVALWQPEMGMKFSYRGVLRWGGIWNKPNLYGLLMSVGLVLAVGMSLRRWRVSDEGQKRTMVLSVYFAAAALTGYGLYKSYSRGAWLAALVGLAYLAVQAIKSSQFPGRIHRNRLPLALLVASLLMLMYWQFCSVELRPAQRIFSAINVNDFSWRNRVAAWEGAARMMVDQPLTGFGWGQAEDIYGKKYCSPRLNEPAAIEMNDYLMIGISAGMPAMFCFLIYVGLSLSGKSGVGKGVASLSITHHPSIFLSTTCRAGAIVLLVGFWFDGGLFKLPTAVVFWMLLELSRLEWGGRRYLIPTPNNESGNGVQRTETPCLLGKWEIRLRWVAAILTVGALTETALHVVPPHFAVSEGTLSIARKILVAPKQKADFEALAGRPIWSGQKLKTLLEHVELAGYNRELINWQLDDAVYRDFVLSPVITGEVGEQLNWRRPLWEEFYPRIRHESSPEDAAKIVVRHLRERVVLASTPILPHNVSAIWLKQITDEVGFQIIYLATLRSVGVPARLNAGGRAEFYDGTRWVAAPSPSVESF